MNPLVAEINTARAGFGQPAAAVVQRHDAHSLSKTGEPDEPGIVSVRYCAAVVGECTTLWYRATCFGKPPGD